MNNDLSVGFSRVTVNPPMGIPIAGYFVERFADGILDDLEIVVLAIASGNKKALLITVDNCGIRKEYLTPWREMISKHTSVDADAIFIHSTHTHTAPLLDKDNPNPLIRDYERQLEIGIVEVSLKAISDLKPAKMGIGITEAKNIAFVRRFRMKDGTAKTNPGVNNPDIVAPIGDVDERVNVLRFDREGAQGVVLVNFGNHPDVVGGSKISGDWVAMTRRFVEKSLDCACIFFNGVQGDVNHVNVHPKAGDFNDLFLDFDGCSRGYGHARHIARVITGAVMSIYDKVEWLDVNQIKYVQKTVEIPSNKADPKDLPLAHQYNDWHNAGRDDLIPYEAMMLTTVVAEAARMVRLENAPDSFPMLFSAVAIGDVALFGIPGEPFTGVGRRIKEAEGWKLVLPCCNTNAKEGYFPMIDSYEEGGYEARSSNFKADVAEKIIEEGLNILSSMRRNH